MKTTDNYKAKYRLWAENVRVIPEGDAGEASAFPQPEIFVARGNERLETVGPPAVGRIRASA